MPTDPVVSLVLMTCHDFLYYASQDYGAVARPSNIIGNYALMYALNRQTPAIRRLTSQNSPHYEEDLPRMPVYAPPAGFVDDVPYHLPGSTDRWFRKQVPLCGTTRVPWKQGSAQMITWNSIGESLLDKMEQDNLNLPKVGAYYRHPPLSFFYFYSIGLPVPSVVRIGKKYIPARLAITPLNVITKIGVFQPTCPVTVADLPENTKIRSGSLLTIPPTPVVLAAELEGPYFECTDEHGLIHRFPIPKKESYRTVWNMEAG